MSATVRPMTDAEFTAFAEWSIENFASDVAEATSIQLPAARERAAAQFDEMLPDGRATAGHHLLIVLDEERTVGRLWIGPHPELADAAFVYDIVIDEPERGKGFGRGAMLAAEELAKSDRSTAIGLSVFASNAGAQGLYTSLGYDVVSTQMLKKLD